jgi:hypothetical protein
MENYYARLFPNMLIVRAAGNSASTGDRACQLTGGGYNTNGICVGGVNSNHARSCFSNFVNPANSDREEPDVMAGAGERDANCVSQTEGVDVALVKTWTTEWGASPGTSFAAPTVTSIAALTREACAWRWPDMDHRIIRAIMRTAASKYNPSGLRYSTPTQGVDWEDGAGFVSAQLVEPFCDAGMRANSGLDSPNLLTGDGSNPQGSVEYEVGQPGEGTGGSGFSLQAFTSPNDGTRVWQVVSDLGYLTPGVKVRATISWDTCTDDVDLDHIDYDLFLYRQNPEGSGFVTASQSADDVEEGFDFQIGTADNYVLYAGWVPRLGCHGASTEVYGWAWQLL